MTEDAVQNVLLAIHEKRHTYDPSRPFGPWLAAIARYKWIDRLRSLKADAAEPLDENIGVPDHGDAVIAGSTFQQLLTALKPPQTEAIRLVKLEGYSVEEASRATGQSGALPDCFIRTRSAKRREGRADQSGRGGSRVGLAKDRIGHLHRKVAEIEDDRREPRAADVSKVSRREGGAASVVIPLYVGGLAGGRERSP
jgi:hypothetical protein